MTETTQLWYSVGDDDCRFKIKTAYMPELDFEMERVIEEAAEDYHCDHDGWEDDWPLDFTLWKEEEGGEPLGRFSVERENRPCFSARME